MSKRNVGTTKNYKNYEITDEVKMHPAAISKIYLKFLFMPKIPVFDEAIAHQWL